jgi:ABC-2 type transport system permease protein
VTGLTATVAQSAANPTLPARTRFLQDVGTVMIRELRPTLRDPFSLIFSLLQPLILLGFFGPLLGGVGGDGAAVDGSTLQWFVPGVLVMIGVFGTANVGWSLLTEMQTGAHERMLVSPLRRSSLIIGRALKEMAPIVVQAVIIITLVVPFGFRLHVAGAFTGLAILGLLGVGIGALSYTLAILSKSRDWIFWGVTQTLTFPVLILSGLLLPLDAAPGWMRAAARVNPMYYVVTAERALFAGEFPAFDVTVGAAAAFASALLGLVLGARVMRHASA